MLVTTTQQHKYDSPYNYNNLAITYMIYRTNITTTQLHYLNDTETASTPIHAHRSRYHHTTPTLAAKHAHSETAI